MDANLDVCEDFMLLATYQTRIRPRQKLTLYQFQYIFLGSTFKSPTAKVQPIFTYFQEKDRKHAAISHFNIKITVHKN